MWIFWNGMGLVALGLILIGVLFMLIGGLFDSLREKRRIKKEKR